MIGHGPRKQLDHNVPTVTASECLAAALRGPATARTLQATVLVVRHILGLDPFARFSTKRTGETPYTDVLEPRPYRKEAA